MNFMWTLANTPVSVTQTERSLRFHPQWPWQDALNRFFTSIGFGNAAAVVWNIVLGALALGLVIYVYRKEGRSLAQRIGLAFIRCIIIAFLLVLLNKPEYTDRHVSSEPSVVAIMVDDSASMGIQDVKLDEKDEKSQVISRYQAVLNALDPEKQELIKGLAEKHQIHLYRFNSQAVSALVDTAAATRPSANGAPDHLTAVSALAKHLPQGEATQVLGSIRSSLEDLKTHVNLDRLAGVVILTDGRSTPAEPFDNNMAAIAKFGVKIYPVVVGSKTTFKNLRLDSVKVQDTAFEGDIVNIKTLIRGQGFSPGQVAKVMAINRKTGKPLIGLDNRPLIKDVIVEENRPVETELQWKPERVGTVDIDVIVQKEEGEIDTADNSRPIQIDVLEAKINVLYIDGYPRWEYRYIKNEMIRDQTVNISCILASADPGFAQEGDPQDAGFPGPLKYFPENLDDLLKFDVVVIGDVHYRHFTEKQLLLIKEFVSKRGGGLAMISGTKNAPAGYRHSVLEDVLPVDISRTAAKPPANIRDGWRPVLTKEGRDSSIFRFFPDQQRNLKFISEESEVMFWFCQGVTVKPGVGETYAQHPKMLGPDGKPAPLLVVGRYGAGRTLFSAIDDSWRWRYYTGEQVFTTYWVQQFRYLARSKKIGQRGVTFLPERHSYEKGEQVRLVMRVIDPKLLPKFGTQIPVEITNEKNEVVSKIQLVRQEGQSELYIASFTGDTVGKFRASTGALPADIEARQLNFEVEVSKLELQEPLPDPETLKAVYKQTTARPDEAIKVRTLKESNELVKVIPVMAREFRSEDNRQPVWNRPWVLFAFVLLITSEWVLRKAFGML